MISKTLSTSQKRSALHQVVPDLAEFCQQLYPLLVAHADDFGRLSGDPFTIKHAIDPTSPRPLADFATALEALHEVDLIVWYSGAGRRFVQVTQFDEHQSGLHKRTASVFPEPSGTSGNFPEFPKPADSLGKGTSGNFREIPAEEKRTEGKRRELKKDVSSAPPSDAEPALLTFPTVGNGSKTWGLTEAHVTAWLDAYPGLDVLGECRRALAWVNANQAKTAKGMPAFLVNWFNRAVQRGGNSRPLGLAANQGAPVNSGYTPAALARIKAAGGAK